MCRLLLAAALACALARAHGAEETSDQSGAGAGGSPYPSPSGAEFLHSVIGRIGGKHETGTAAPGLARPVADLK